MAVAIIIPVISEPNTGDIKFKLSKKLVREAFEDLYYFRKALGIFNISSLLSRLLHFLKKKTSWSLQIRSLKKILLLLPLIQIDITKPKF